MKRGNTALKRAVSVTSVAAMAIAGAVLAAPAANALTLTTPATTAANTVRAIPAADAAWMSSTGSVNSTKATTAVTYGLSSPVVGTDHATGVAANLTVGKNGQAVTGIQVKLPTGSTGKPLWTAGQYLTVTLDGGTNGNGTPNVSYNGGAVATLSAAPLADPSDLAQVAGVSNAAGHQSAAALAANANTVDLANTAGTVAKVSGQPNEFTVALPDPGNATGDTAAATAYLLTITGVTVNIAASNNSTAANVPVTANVTGSLDGGTTTVGYINGLNIATNGTSTATSNVVSLPPVVVSGAAVGALSAAGFSFQATGTPATGSALTAVVPTTGVTKSATNSMAVGNITTPGNADTFAVAVSGTPSATSNEAVVISGLQVSNVKPGTDVTLTIKAPTSATVNLDGNSPAAASTFSFVAGQTAGSSTVVSPTTALPRIAGTNRFDTAAKIADKLGATNAVILANADNAKLGVDALSANFLAGAKAVNGKNAPVLLTGASTLAPETAAELTKLFTDSTANITLYVMGKTDSVSQKVRDAAVEAIKAKAVNALATVTVVEVSGSDRYATSAETVAKAGVANIGAFNLGAGSRNTAFLASGQVNADALAASAVSAGLDIPVLLTTDGKTLPDSVQKVITDDNITQVIVLGSTDRVSKDVADALTKAGVNVVRIEGSDRYDTAQQLATLALKAQPNGLGLTNGGTVYLANGQGGWPDALAIGPLAGTQGASLVTVSDAASLPGSTAVFLASNKGAFAAVDGLGSTDRVTDSALKQAIAISGLS